jgi:Protein of unknown function (DUF751)
MAKEHGVEEIEVASSTGMQQCQPEANLLARLVATANVRDGASVALIAALGGALVLGMAEPALASASHDHFNVASDLAEEPAFWSNVLRYVSYFFSVLLGTAYIAVKPLVEMSKRPTTAVLVVVGCGLVFFFVSVTVQTMLGMNDVMTYEPSSIVTPVL